MAKVFLCALCMHAAHIRRLEQACMEDEKKSFGFILVPFHYHYYEF